MILVVMVNSVICSTSENSLIYWKRERSPTELRIYKVWILVLWANH